MSQVTADADRAVMLLYDSLTDRQTQSRSLSGRGESHLEDLREILGPDAAAGISEPNDSCRSGLRRLYLG